MNNLTRFTRRVLLTDVPLRLRAVSFALLACLAFSAAASAQDPVTLYDPTAAVNTLAQGMSDDIGVIIAFVFGFMAIGFTVNYVRRYLVKPR